ncbi:MAG: cysteine hydrolase [Spirochaetes bacterium]|nr:cysteine hydrolase [Spirochaetota bacterium]
MIWHDPGTLYITGLAAEVCVNSTIKGAIANGYRVYVIKEAVLSIRGGSPDRKQLDKYRSYGAEIISVNDLK